MPHLFNQKKLFKFYHKLCYLDYDFKFFSWVYNDLSFQGEAGPSGPPGPPGRPGHEVNIYALLEHDGYLPSQIVLSLMVSVLSKI